MKFVFDETCWVCKRETPHTSRSVQFIGGSYELFRCVECGEIEAFCLNDRGEILGEDDCWDCPTLDEISLEEIKGCVADHLFDLQENRNLK